LINLTIRIRAGAFSKQRTAARTPMFPKTIATRELSGRGKGVG
jgi:hypothetical protein